MCCLDIGCGEGSISDFLTEDQKHEYVGVDLAKEAIIAAKKARGPPLKFVHAAAHQFVPQHKFDAIVFSDVLHYVEHSSSQENRRNLLGDNMAVAGIYL